MSPSLPDQNQQAPLQPGPHPNLRALTASLREAQAARASRSTRGGRHAAPSSNAPSSTSNKDSIVQSTDDDASGSRLSAVSLGYLIDPFAPLLAKTPEVIRRMPIINRGTYVRTTALDRMVLQFLNGNTSKQKQVISLGAGTDTRCFRFTKEGLLRNESGDAAWHELDFPHSMDAKQAVIERTPALKKLAGSLRLHGMDLRDLKSTNNVAHPLIPGLSSDAETLILSEMCLSYIPSKDAIDILTSLLELLSSSPRIEILLYEPLQPNDAFGRTMVSNLAARNISLLGLLDVPTLDAHRQRLQELGFTSEQKAWTVRQIWEEWIRSEEKERLRSLEMVDEEEEWHLLAEHYGVIWARKEREAVT